MEPLISVLIPLYGVYINQIKNFSDSLMETVGDIDGVKFSFDASAKSYPEKMKLMLEKSTGRYIFFAAQDLIFRTKDWDRAVLDAFAKFPDDIAMVYGNDLLFQGKLACFPFLSRKALEITGIPTQYKHFRIDDHIHHTYDLLRRIGHNRIVYLPDVIFEHDHYVLGPDGQRHYANSRAAIEDDESSRIYFDSMCQRKTDAIKLALAIDQRPGQGYYQKLSQIQDPYPWFVRVD